MVSRQSSLLQEWICFALVPNSGQVTVAGHDDGFIRQGEQAAVERIDDLLEAAAGQVSATDATLKQRVTGDELFLGREVEADAALRVSRGVQD